MARPLRWHNSIDSFATEDCYNFFRVQKKDLPRLFAALRFSDECKTSNRLAFSGQEIMLRGLYELVSGEDQYNIAVNVFGRDQSAQSQAFATFVTFIYDNFLDLLTDNLEWWEQEGFMEKSNHAIVKLNGRLNALPGQWQTYGDSIYPLLANIMSGVQHSQFWKKLRCSIEWNYSVTSYNLFKYLSHFNKLRLLSSEKVTKVYTVGTFLRNCHVALYGCQSMEYFDLRLPVDMLERYTRLH